MATYIACASTAFNTGTTWALVDATSILDSEATNTEPAAGSYSESSNFNVAADNYDGVAVKLAVSGSGAYTISLHINQTGVGEVAGTAVTINRADLPSGVTAANNDGGWVFFKFGAPVALAAATNYTVGLQESNAAADVRFYVSATTDWSRMLRSSTAFATSAPAAASVFHIMEEKTGAGSATTRTVTMDAVAGAITKYGAGTDNVVALTISDGGTLTYGITGGTAYYLQLDGNLIVYNGGTLKIGDIGGNEVPRNSTAVLEFDPTADGGQGLTIKNGANFVSQGLSRTSGKNIVSCKLNTDELAGSTNLGVDTDTGWLDNDVIAVASTSQTYSQCEKGTLNGDAAAAALTVDGFAGAGGGLANNHSGTDPTQAEIILITRNVIIRSTSSTIMTYLDFKSTSIVNMDWTEVYYIGENTANKRGIEIETETGSCTISYCSVHDTEDLAIYISAAVNSNNITIEYTNMWNCATVIQNIIFLTAATTGTSIILDNNIIMYSAKSSQIGLNLSDVGITVTNNTVCGLNGTGISLAESNAIGTVNLNTSHSNSGNGMQVSLISRGTISNTKVWRNAGTGLQISNGNTLTFNILSVFGHTTQNIQIQNGVGITLISPTISGDTTFASLYGLTIGSTASVLLAKIINGNFGTVTGIYTAHTGGDIYTNNIGVRLFLQNTILASTVEVFTQTNMADVQEVGIFSSKHDQLTGANLMYKSWKKNGTISTDSTVGLFRTTAPSEKLVPNSASLKLESGSFKVNVNNTQTCTPSVYVRESVVGDGEDYNGNRIRLILKRNDAIGITADAVIDTATVSSEGAFEELTGTTAAATDNGVMEFVVDCDGTTGWINVDDITATVT